MSSVASGVNILSKPNLHVRFAPDPKRDFAPEPIGLEPSLSPSPPRFQPARRTESTNFQSESNAICLPFRSRSNDWSRPLSNEEISALLSSPLVDPASSNSSNVSDSDAEVHLQSQRGRTMAIPKPRLGSCYNRKLSVDSGYCSVSGDEVDEENSEKKRCAVCNKPSTQLCSTCGAIAYCGTYHAEFDKTVHNLLCKNFAAPPRPDRQMSSWKVVLVFPANGQLPFCTEINPETYKDASGCMDIKDVVINPKSDTGIIKLGAFELDHVIRLVPLRQSEDFIQRDDNTAEVRMNQSILNCTAKGLLQPCFVVRGSVMAICYRKEKDTFHWLDCSPADFRHVLLWLQKEQQRQLVQHKRECPTLAVVEDDPRPIKRAKSAPPVINTQRASRDSSSKMKYGSSMASKFRLIWAQQRRRRG